MKLRLIFIMLACILLLGGCSWPDGSYHSVTPHREPAGTNRTDNLTVSNYEELKAVMEAVVAKGTESTICRCAAALRGGQQYRQNRRGAGH